LDNLRNVTDDVIYPQVGENEEHPLEWTTSTMPIETDPYIRMVMDGLIMPVESYGKFVITWGAIKEMSE
jgi:hypothetical protein